MVNDKAKKVVVFNADIPRNSYVELGTQRHASMANHIVPHDVAEESKVSESENGISITVADAEGIEEPKK